MTKQLNGTAKWIGLLISAVVICGGLVGGSWVYSANLNTRVEIHIAGEEERDKRMEENIGEIRIHLEKIEAKLEKL